jgi:CubicO group peptidase (beta-lactamase class C family)
MKKFYYILSIFFILNFNYAQCQGDTNLDDAINVQDIILIVNHILLIDLLQGTALNNADTNNDGGINVIDVVLVTNLIINNLNQCENSTPIDLSLEWEFEEDLSYFNYEELQNIINNQIEELNYLKGIVIIHNGKIISEEYYNGSSISEIYNIWSVTKSYTSTLIGQAIDQELIFNSDYTLNNFLPNYINDYLETVTLHDLLSMSSGYFDYYGYPTWVNVSTSELVSMPYSGLNYFNYNNSACHLNSHIIYEGTGMTPMQFADDNLFPYLGITNPYWLDGYNNINDGSASLYLRLRDMVKLGQLFVQDGYASENNQIISSDWIEKATSEIIPTGIAGLDNYGYLWWIPQEGYLAYGFGGQFIAVIPEKNLVIGTHSDIYSNQLYQTTLLNIIYNQIAPIFEND